MIISLSFHVVALPCTRPILSYVQSHSKEAESMDYLVNVCMQMIKSKSQLNGENQVEYTYTIPV